MPSRGRPFTSRRAYATRAPTLARGIDGPSKIARVARPSTGPVALPAFRQLSGLARGWHPAATAKSATPTARGMRHERKRDHEVARQMSAERLGIN